MIDYEERCHKIYSNTLETLKEFAVNPQTVLEFTPTRELVMVFLTETFLVLCDLKSADVDAFNAETNLGLTDLEIWKSYTKEFIDWIEEQPWK